MTLIDNFLTDTYTVTRSLGGSYVNGIYVSDGDETLTVKGSLQPMTPREIKLAEEAGERLTDGKKFYADTDLRVIDRATGLKRSDKVTINGETYKVVSVTIWQGLRVDLPHYKHILNREPQP